MRDDETESYRAEQGKPPHPDPREHLGDVPIVFSSEGGGAGVLLPGTADRLGPPPDGLARSAITPRCSSAVIVRTVREEEVTLRSLTAPQPSASATNLERFRPTPWWCERLPPDASTARWPASHIVR